MNCHTLILLSLMTVLVRGVPMEEEEQQDQEEDQVTRVLTIENVLSTTKTTVMHTNIVYPTCTTTVTGISACAGPNTRLPEGAVDTQIKPSATHQDATHTQTQVTGEEEEEAEKESSSSTFQLAEVVMPSCDCFEENPGRSPRILSHNVITIKSTTTITNYSVVTSTDTSTTVSITYNGCIPHDAPVTRMCEV